jgi:hypothetical protein
MPISFKQKGNFNKLDTFFQRSIEILKLSDLDKYGREGVAALRLATPKDSGYTAACWSYNIVRKNDSITLEFYNSNMVGPNGRYSVPVAILLQYGHATKHGGFVQGTDYINPSIRPIFERIADNAWKDVTRL